MLSGSTWVHLRLPFSWVLAPVFLFAGVHAGAHDTRAIATAAVCVFLLLYPASHAFNSYYDRDERSIAGVRAPPPVTRELLIVAWILDASAILLALTLSASYALLLLIYLCASRAYSHPWTRWKARPFFSWVVVAVMQGPLIFQATLHALSGLDLATLFQSTELASAAGITLLWIGSSYPLTQVYQHEEDAHRGDKTLSRVLGVRGTFVFTGAGFVLAQAALALHAHTFSRWPLFIAVQIGLVPSLVYFGPWVVRVWRGEAPRFEHVMAMTWLSATGLNVALLWLWGRN